MLSFVREDLTAGMEYVVAVRPDAVDVVTGAAETTLPEGTRFILHVLLESVLGQSFVLYVVRLVLFCKRRLRF